MKCCSSYDGKFSLGLNSKKPLPKNPNIFKGIFQTFHACNSCTRVLFSKMAKLPQFFKFFAFLSFFSLVLLFFFKKNTTLAFIFSNVSLLINFTKLIFGINPEYLVFNECELVVILFRRLTVLSCPQTDQETLVHEYNDKKILRKI